MRNLSSTLILKLVFLLFFGLVFNTNLQGQTDSTNVKEKTEKSIKKNKGKTNADEKKEKSDEKEKAAADNYPKVSEDTIQYISIGFFVVMILLISLFFYSKRKAPYLGFHSIKFIGLILIFPGICILALISKDLINGSTLAALFGTIAGYVLSRDKEDDSDSSALRAKFKEEKQKLLDEISDLEDEITKLNKN
ncbi:hypothetical protein WIW50_15010 [Flavobacteriaceae bacterium 3-367]